MRLNITLSLLALLSFSCGTTGEAAETRGQPVDLFTAAGPNGWKSFCEVSQADPDRIRELRDGVVVLKAGPRGYIRTEQDFTSFSLSLHWRRPPGQKPGRGGVLIRMSGEDKIWPKSLEAQLNADAAGDFWGLVGYRLSGPTERLQQLKHDQFGTLTNLKKTEGAEKPVGQWNQYEILADGETVTLKINGELVNRATGCDVVAGKICLTAEGDEIHFRNIRLTPIPD